MFCPGRDEGEVPLFEGVPDRLGFLDDYLFLLLFLSMFFFLVDLLAIAIYFFGVVVDGDRDGCGFFLVFGVG